MAVTEEKVAKTAVVAIAIAALGFTALVLLRCGYGFDFSDEGMHLNAIAYPWDFGPSVTQFGFVYHPVYWLLDGDLELLRRFNIGLTFVLAGALAGILLRRDVGDSKEKRTAGVGSV